jgi:hypothetical protein
LHFSDVQIRQCGMKGINGGLDVIAVGALLGVANSITCQQGNP